MLPDMREQFGRLIGQVCGLIPICGQPCTKTTKAT
jgi:hypothetical protein